MSGGSCLASGPPLTADLTVLECEKGAEKGRVILHCEARRII